MDTNPVAFTGKVVKIVSEGDGETVREFVTIEVDKVNSVHFGMSGAFVRNQPWKPAVERVEKVGLPEAP